MAKLAIVAVLAILCVNLSIFIVNEYGILPQSTVITPILPGDVTGNVDINGTITPNPSINQPFNDIWGGANKLWRLITTLVTGLPNLLSDFGTPGPVALVLNAIYYFILGVFFIEIILGRGDVLD